MQTVLTSLIVIIAALFLIQRWLPAKLKPSSLGKKTACSDCSSCGHCGSNEKEIKIIRK